MPTKDEAARDLATKHYQVESGLTHIFRLSGGADVEIRATEPIKLLEINAATVSSGVLPLHFGPAPASGVPYPSIIIEVTPEEFDKIRTKTLSLPDGWTIGEELPRPAGGDGA